MNRRWESRIAAKKERLEAYYNAEEAILSGAQSYRLGSRSLTKADLAVIGKRIKELEGEIDEMEAIAEGQARRRAVAVVPQDW